MVYIAMLFLLKRLIRDIAYAQDSQPPKDIVNKYTKTLICRFLTIYYYKFRKIYTGK